MKDRIIILSLFISNLIYILYNSLGISNVMKNGIRISVIGLLLFSIFFNRKTITFIKMDLIWIFLLLFSLFSFTVSHNIVNFIYIILVLIVSRDMKKDKLIKWNYYIMVISALLVVLLLTSGLISNIQYSVGGRTRYTFGFFNVNAFSNLVYSFFIMHFMYKDRLRKFEIVSMVALMYFIFRYTDTRTTIMAFIIFIVFYVILRKAFTSKRLIFKVLFGR